jgi:hypothetical protein
LCSLAKFAANILILRQIGGSATLTSKCSATTIAKTKKHFVSDFDRFSMLTDNLLGKRITYQQLIGRGLETQAN